jgi:hypothetical protein
MHSPSVKLLSLALYTSLGVCLPNICSAQIEIPEGTKVRVRLDQQLSSETAKEGQLVQLSVADDVKIGDVVAIKSGSVVNGTVVSVVHTRSFARKGKFDFSIDAVIVSDGGKIPLRYSQVKTEGATHAVRNGLMTAGFGLVGLLTLEGGDAVLFEGATFEVFTDANYTVKPKADVPSGPGAKATAQSAGSMLLDAPSIGAVYLLDSSNQTLKPLPDEAWTAHASGDTANIEVNGERSYIRIANDKPEFVFEIGNPENAKLYAFTIDNKNEKEIRRRFSLVHKVGKARQTSPGIPVEISKFAESSYKLVPVPSLRPGEYAILLSGSKVFTFGIDQ